MHKEKITLGSRMIHWVTSHPWFKLIALILAIMVWFYVKGEINRFN
jgi:Ca2+-dependent lipid-binding protein